MKRESEAFNQAYKIPTFNKNVEKNDQAKDIEEVATGRQEDNKKMCSYKQVLQEGRCGQLSRRDSNI